MKSYTALVPIQSTELAKVGNILKITHKLLSKIKLVPYLKKNGKYIYVDSVTMKPVLDRNEYDRANLYSDGFANVMLNRKWGFIDMSGKEVIPLIYDMVGDFSEGLVGVKIDSKWGFINKKGKIVVPTIYDRVYSFSEGFAQVKNEFKHGWGFIDIRGKEVVQLNYYEVSRFSEGYAYVSG